MFRRTAATLAALTVSSLLFASPAHAATTAPPAEVAAFSVSMPHHAVLVAARTYTVRPGDTLSRIAARFCGNASAYRSIGASSGIGNFNLIYPSQRLTLKCTGGVAPVRRQPAVVHAQTASVAVGGPASTVVSFAAAQVGKRYVWGTAGPSSYDCSGLIMAAFARIGIKLPHQAAAIARYGRPVSGALQPGDLLFLSGRGGVYHVIIYAGGGQVIEAASPGQGVVRHAIYPYSFARRLV